MSKNSSLPDFKDAFALEMESEPENSSSESPILTTNFATPKDSQREAVKGGLTFRPVLGQDETGRDGMLLKLLNENFEENLFKWHSFPLVLPSLLRPDGSATLKTEDLFNFPELNELDAIAFGEGATPKLLSREQLKSIRRNGEFLVPSKNFPRQNHKWRLSLLLQKGSERGRKNLRKGLALALKLIVIYSKGRFVGKNFSLKKALKAWIKIPTMFSEVFFGLPSMEVVAFDFFIQRELFLFIYEELTIESERMGELRQFKEFVFEIFRESVRTHNFYQVPTSITANFPRLIYTFAIDKEIDNCPIIDFRLSNPEIWSKVKSIFAEVLELERNRDEWFIDYRDRTIDELKSDLPSEEIDTKLEIVANRRIRDEFLRRIYENLANNRKLAEIDANLGRALIDQIKSILVLEESVMEYQECYDDSQANLEADLRTDYPIRSLIKRWMRRQLRYATEKFHQQNKWKVFDLAIEKTRAAQLNQANYFFSRVTEFEKHKKPALEADLSKIKEPSRIFNWREKIWLPGNYILRKIDNETGESMRIHPVEFKTDPITREMAGTCTQSFRYTLCKEELRQTTTRYPFWRWFNFFNRCRTWTLNGIFYLLIAIPYCSSLSFRALFSPTVFYPSYTVDGITGQVGPKMSSKTHSFLSRMRALWRHVRHSREKFENAVDRGFLGKNVTRPLNRFWNYVIKGAFGSVILTVVFPPLCLLASTGSFLVGLTCPLWVWIVVLGFHLFCIFIFDKDAPRRNEGKNRVSLVFDLVLYRFLCLGIIQPISALITALILCPVGSVLVTAGSYLVYGIRSFWDTTMFHILIKRFGRLPASDSWVARRVAGPGLSGNYFYQIGPEQALALLEKKIEEDELNEFVTETKWAINEPIRVYRNRVATLFGPFGGQTNEGFPGFLEVKRVSAGFEKRLDSMVSERRKQLSLDLHMRESHKIRMNSKDLNLTLKVAGDLLKKLYPERVIGRMQREKQNSFWKDRNLAQADWEGLARKIFSEIFSLEFPIPLEEGETRFQLEVEHLDLKSYMDQLISAEHREDLENAVPTQVPAKQKWASIALPSWDGNRFSEPYFYNPINATMFQGIEALSSVIRRDFMERDIGIVMALVYNRMIREGKVAGDKEIPCDNEACLSLLRQLALASWKRRNLNK